MQTLKLNEIEADNLASAMRSAMEGKKLTDDEKAQLKRLWQAFQHNDVKLVVEG